MEMSQKALIQKILKVAGGEDCNPNAAPKDGPPMDDS
jgi:hypothetical protein